MHTITGELRELVDQFPGVKDTTVEGGVAERLAARSVLKEIVLTMRRIGLAAATDRFDEAAREYQSYRIAFAEVPFLLKTAAPWSLLIRSCIERILRRCVDYFRRPTSFRANPSPDLRSFRYRRPRRSSRRGFISRSS